MNRHYWHAVLLGALMIIADIPARAQFNITPLAVSPVYLKSQLWSLTITNSGSPVQGRIQINMTDMQTHQSVLSAATATLRIPTGVLMAQLSSLEPVTYSYNSPVVVDRSPNGVLPIGQYQVCYQLLVSYSEGQTVAAEDCEEIAVEPLSPPLLTLPEDDSVVTVSLPNFTWMPPTPLNMFSNLTYDILISEVEQGQSVTDAIQKNLPLQQAQGLQQPFLTYPLTGPQLEDNKIYAWQVIARDQSRYAAKSEVWSFRMPVRKISPVNSNTVYLVMDGHASGVGTVDSTILHIKYVSVSPAYLTMMQISDENQLVLLSGQYLIRQGDNYLDIPLNGNFVKKQLYTAGFQDKTGKRSTIKFMIN